MSSSLSLPFLFSSALGLWIYARSKLLNSCSAETKVSPLNETAYWQHLWNSGAQWHRTEPNPSLLNNMNKFPPVNTIKTSSSPIIFLPLCGKTVDLIYLSSIGYRVIGVEFIAEAVFEFFNENKSIISEFTVKVISSNLTVFTATESINNLDLQIYCCDIYCNELNRELIGSGGVDVIWDRGALVAIHRKDRVKYMKKLISLLKPKQSRMNQLLANTMNHKQVKEMFRKSIENENKDEKHNNNDSNYDGENDDNISILCHVVSYAQIGHSVQPFSVTDNEFRTLFNQVDSVETDETDRINVNFSEAEKEALLVKNRVTREGNGKYEISLVEDNPSELVKPIKLDIIRDRTYAVTLLK